MKIALHFCVHLSSISIFSKGRSSDRETVKASSAAFGIFLKLLRISNACNLVHDVSITWALATLSEQRVARDPGSKVLSPHPT